MASAAAEQMEIDEQKIDEGLYSRQLYVLGAHRQRCSSPNADPRSFTPVTCSVMKVLYSNHFGMCLKTLMQRVG